MTDGNCNARRRTFLNRILQRIEERPQKTCMLDLFNVTWDGV